MQFTKESFTIQQLATGEKLMIHSYTCTGAKEGPTIYLQANLHGPEIIGTPLLGKIISYVETLDDIPGKIIIVPCANPMAVQTKTYNSHSGRWNPTNGINWNRIFKTNTTNNSIEQNLAAHLMALSHDADYCIDIHTTGSKNINHIFTFNHSHNVFAPLEAHIHLECDPNNLCSTFDEAHIALQKNDSPQQWPHVCTWEIHNHSDIDAHILEQRFVQLKNWLHSIWDEQVSTHTPQHIIPLNKAHDLYAIQGGYYIWQANVGDVVKKGQMYAMAYQPTNNVFSPIQAENDFVLLGIYGIQAPAQGESIAFIADIT